MRTTQGLWLMMTLLTGCECGAPWMASDCALPGIYLTVLDADGQRLQADHIAVYQDEVLVQDLECATSYCEDVIADVYQPGVYRIEVRVGARTQTFEQEVLGIPEGQCCGGYFQEAVMTFERPAPADTCAALDVDTCAATSGCDVIAGWETTPDTSGGLCVDYASGQVGFACQSADLDCAAVISHAQPPEGGACVVFGGCVPPGWTACDGDPTINECSTI